MWLIPSSFWTETWEKKTSRGCLLCGLIVLMPLANIHGKTIHLGDARCFFPLYRLWVGYNKRWKTSIIWNTSRKRDIMFTRRNGVGISTWCNKNLFSGPNEHIPVKQQKGGSGFFPLYLNVSPRQHPRPRLFDQLLMITSHVTYYADDMLLSRCGFMHNRCCLRAQPHTALLCVFVSA